MVQVLESPSYIETDFYQNPHDSFDSEFQESLALLKSFQKSELRKTLDQHFDKEYYLFGLESQKKVFFSKAPIRGNTPYGFWIENRLEEITDEIQFFANINQKEKKSNMLNILLTIDRNGLGVNQNDSWLIFKAETTKYITRIKRALKEKFGIDSIGHFRVFEAHLSGYCHAHLCLILDSQIEYDLKMRYNPKSHRRALVGEIRDQKLKDEILSWHFSNGASIGKESISAVYSPERLIEYLTKYFGKNQTFMKNSFERLKAGNYQESEKVKMSSDLKKVLGFFFAVKNNMRLFRHSIKKAHRVNYLEHLESLKLKINDLILSGLSLEEVAKQAGLSKSRVIRLVNSMAPLANEPLNNVHDDFKSDLNREYFGVLSRVMLSNLFEVSEMSGRAVMAGGYMQAMTKDEKQKMTERGNYPGLDDFFERVKDLKDPSEYREPKPEKEILEFSFDLENSPVIKGFIYFRKKYEEQGKKLSFQRYMLDFQNWHEKNKKREIQERENVQNFLERFHIELDRKKRVRVKEIKKRLRENRGF